MELKGLHHVTAVTRKASLNVVFYTQVLGLRLVKKTVNQDDVSAYHFFYGDALGHPGTEMTFFDWEFSGRHVPGSGMIAATSFRVPGRSALEWWVQRFDTHGVPHSELTERAGRRVLCFADPEGQQLELFDDTAASTQQGVPPRHALGEEPGAGRAGHPRAG